MRSYLIGSQDILVLTSGFLTMAMWKGWSWVTCTSHTGDLKQSVGNLHIKYWWWERARLKGLSMLMFHAQWRSWLHGGSRPGWHLCWSCATFQHWANISCGAPHHLISSGRQKGGCLGKPHISQFWLGGEGVLGLRFPACLCWWGYNEHKGWWRGVEVSSYQEDEQANLNVQYCSKLHRNLDEVLEAFGI